MRRSDDVDDDCTRANLFHGELLGALLHLHVHLRRPVGARHDTRRWWSRRPDPIAITPAFVPILPVVLFVIKRAQRPIEYVQQPSARSLRFVPHRNLSTKVSKSQFNLPVILVSDPDRRRLTRRPHLGDVFLRIDDDGVVRFPSREFRERRRGREDVVAAKFTIVDIVLCVRVGAFIDVLRGEDVRASAAFTHCFVSFAFGL